ncbi:hypothetical protein GCM10010218_10690 [Streptomyces mashuensis]|uniref:Cation/H+ exchanger transmembrane domain-containing protein n=1 Tax=Streptomyces mashuensis TaxID=33904 RepID=A0A919EAZ0_9ACTN|nr:cation:proton antiporter [Streptomyces mashuensis]GHF31681.1 hypothetical protein GCM10010218_10690 [Streptomyces mashuensis]
MALPAVVIVAVVVATGGGDASRGARAAPAGFTLDTTGHFFLGVAVVLGASHLTGALAARLGQPRVIGEIAAGIALGPSLLGSLSPGTAHWLFPSSVTPMFQGLAQAGLVLFMFGVGQELGAMPLRGAAQRALLVSGASLLVPMAAGVAVAVPLAGRYAGRDTGSLPFVLFLGCALSITAFPVLARILDDLRITRTEPGQLSLFAAAVGDGGSWLLLAAVLALSHGGDPAQLLVNAVCTLAVAGLFLGPVRALLNRWPDRPGRGPGAATVMTLLVVGVAATATLTALLGIHQLIGALLVGLVWPARHRGAAAAAAPLATVSKTVLLPFFFLGFGLTADLRSIGLDTATVLTLGALLLVAVVAKIAGPGLCAWLTGLPPRTALTLGVLLNARGLTELVVLQIGYEAHVIDQRMLSMLTIVALVTTVMTTPLLKALRLGRLQQSAAEQQAGKQPELQGTGR